MEDFSDLCERLVDKNMKFCPGIDDDEYKVYRDIIRYDQKRVIITEEPFKRICSAKCKLWFPVARCYSKTQKLSVEVVSHECVRLKTYLRNSADHIATTSPSRKIEHQQSTSTFPVKYLSPASKNA